MSIKEYDARTLLISTSEDDSLLGRGNFAKVHRCFHDKLGRVAVKCINSFSGSKDHISKQVQEAKKRVDLASRLKHKNIISIYGVILFQETFSIIMEEANFGNLYDVLMDHKDFDIDWITRVNFMLEIANGLDFLHNNNPKKAYIHKDLKSENILLFANMTVKLADFGAFDIKVATGATTSSCISAANQYTLQYSAPEYLKTVFDKASVNLTCAMDVYSYGIVGYEIITRKMAFDAQCKRGVLMCAIIGGTKPQSKYIDEIMLSFENKVGEEKEFFFKLVTIMKKCWNTDPNSRPLISEVCKELHEYVETIHDYKEKVLMQAQSLESSLTAAVKQAHSESTEKQSFAQFKSPLFWDKDLQAMQDDSAGNFLALYAKPYELSDVHTENLSSPADQFGEDNPSLPSTSSRTSLSETKSKKSSEQSDVKVRKELLTSKNADPETGQDKMEHMSENNFFNEEMICYDMNHPQRGCFLIFHFFSFDSSLHYPDRTGSFKDVLKFKHIAVKMGFDYVRVIENCTKRELFDWVLQLARADHSSYDCFGCAVLTYGFENDVLLARDERFHLNELLTYFTSENCPTLAKKPKIFFINACRGENMGPIASLFHQNYFDNIPDSPPPMDELIPVPSFLSSRVADTTDAVQAFPSSTQEHSATCPPHLDDFVIAYSTISGYVSWRNQHNGSWFAQALYYCFRKYCKSLELMQILTRVSKMVSRGFAANTTNYDGSRRRQYPAILSHLTAEVHF